VGPDKRWAMLPATFAVISVLTSAAPVIPVDLVMRDLQVIEAESYRGTVDAHRIELQNELKGAPNDTLLRVKVAWCTLPSDDAWNQLKSIGIIDPDNVWVRYGMGRIYKSWNMADLAMKEFDATLKRDPKFFPSMAGKGQVYLAAQTADKAESSFRSALVLAPQDPFAQAGLGMTLLQKGDKVGAKMQLETTLKSYRELPAALEALLKLQLETNDTASIDTASALVQMRPRDKNLRKTLVDLYLKSQKPALAAKELESLIKLGGGDAATLTQLASLYRDAHDAENEERIVASQVAADSLSVETAFRLAQLRANKSDVAAAESAWKEVLNRDAKNVEALYQMGLFKKKAGVFHEAALFLRSVVKLDESRVDAKTELASLETAFQLPTKKPAGTVGAVSLQVSKTLNTLFLAANPKTTPDGKVRARVRILADGLCESVTVLEDTVKDPNLLGHLVFQLQDATYEKRKGEPVFEFELMRPKGKKKK
jgi:tetratricopeptide (TPR) repeat protein